MLVYFIRHRRGFTALAVLAIVAIFVVGSFSKGPAGVDEHLNKAGQWRPVRAPEAPAELLMQGVIEGVKSVGISAPFEGNVLAVHVAVGDVVGGNSLLMELDPAPIASQLLDARAQTVKAKQVLDEALNWASSASYKSAQRQLVTDEAALSEAQRQLVVSQTLLEAGVVSRNEVDEKRQLVSAAKLQRENSADAVAQIELKSSSAAINLARLEYANQTKKEALLRSKMQRNAVRAPLAGVVTQLGSSDGMSQGSELGNVVGARVSEGSIIARIVDNTRIQVVGTVPESAIGEVKLGHQASIRPAAQPGNVLSGRVVRVSALPNMSDVTFGEERRSARFRVVVEVDSKPDSSVLMPPLGTNADVSIRAGEFEPGVLVDLAAVQARQDGVVVLTVRRNGKILPSINVRVGSTTSDAVYVVDASLRIGDEVWVATDNQDSSEQEEIQESSSSDAKTGFNVMRDRLRSLFSGGNDQLQ